MAVSNPTKPAQAGAQRTQGAQPLPQRYGGRTAMTTQPEALRLADNLDTNGYAMRDLKQAADELRRLHEANQELLKTLRWLDRWMGVKPLLDCANKVRATIAKTTGKTTGKTT